MESLFYLWVMNETQTPNEVLAIIANAVAQLESLNEKYSATIEDFYENESACVETAKEAIKNKSRLEFSGIIDDIKQLQKKLS